MSVGQSQWTWGDQCSPLGEKQKGYDVRRRHSMSSAGPFRVKRKLCVTMGLMIAAIAVEGSPLSGTCSRKVPATMNLLKEGFRAYLDPRTHVMDKATSSTQCHEPKRMDEAPAGSTGILLFAGAAPVNEPATTLPCANQTGHIWSIASVIGYFAAGALTVFTEWKLAGFLNPDDLPQEEPEEDDDVDAVEWLG